MTWLSYFYPTRYLLLPNSDRSSIFSRFLPNRPAFDPSPIQLPHIPTCDPIWNQFLRASDPTLIRKYKPNWTQPKCFQFEWYFRIQISKKHFKSSKILRRTKREQWSNSSRINKYWIFIKKLGNWIDRERMEISIKCVDGDLRTEEECSNKGPMDK